MVDKEVHSSIDSLSLDEYKNICRVAYLALDFESEGENLETFMNILSRMRLELPKTEFLFKLLTRFIIYIYNLTLI